MLSLVDESGATGYYRRAWCCSEALLMETLEKSYRAHQRFEHCLDAPEQSLVAGRLRIPDSIETLRPSQQQLSEESDRSHIEFLERQIKLLGKSKLY
ncbi:Tetratricopeptide repeat-containing protein isoform 2 [Teratosphaeria destructans]|uniref:Tetratricopeptide repeat-containing protein isoform 2 n=1 Tax=Teratosphaeria destructans TaxID=418781 RepID=A0A9W7VZS8_9PEZI|nr:Tetratricopeptide repeat-containing protein isoform 2 [Teratosphaeria destructans]